MSTEPTNDSSELLGQSNTSELLGASPAPRIYTHNGDVHPDAAKLKVENFDFRNPVFLTESELRRLRIRHEDCIRYLSARLSLFLRMEIGLKIAKLSTFTYENLIEGMVDQTHLSLFKAEPLHGVGLLEMNPRLALTLVDRILGGQGQIAKVERYLTEIEIAILEDIETIILEEWCNQWRQEQELRPTLLGHENTGRFLQTSPRNAVMLHLVIEAMFGECMETISLSVPYYTLEPVLKQIQAKRNKETNSGQSEKQVAWHPAYATIGVPVRAEWNACELSLNEILHWRTGDVITLPESLIDQTRLMIADKCKFSGRVGVEGEHFAIEILRREESSKS